MKKPRACSNYDYRQGGPCRGTVTHAVFGRWTALDACERCVRTWYSTADATKQNGYELRIAPTPFSGK